MKDPSEERGGGLGRRFLLGSLYLGAGNWVAYAVNFAIQIAIARILGPSEIGLYAFVFAINEFLNIVAALSLSIALIQSREESQELYDTALAICAVLGLIGLVAAAVVAPLLWEFRSPRAAWFLLAMAVGRILILLAQVPQARLERQLRYGYVGLITIITGNLPNLGALGFALLGFGAWSLLIRDLGVAVLTLFLAALWSGYRFRGRVAREPARRLMTYSTPMLAARSLEIMMDRVDRVTVGSLLGDAATGVYHQARFLSETGNMTVRPVMQLSLNLYSRLQDQRERLARSYSLVNFFLARLMFLGGTTLLIFPEETVRLLLGDEWAGVAPILRWLGLHGALLPVFENAKVLFYAVDRVKWVVRVRLAQLGLFTPAVVAACLSEALAFVAAALLAATMLGLLLFVAPVRRVLGHPAHVLRAPAALFAVTAAAFLGLEAAGLLAPVPWFVRPFLPPLLFAALVAAVDRSRLLRELGFLRRQLRGAPGEEAASVDADAAS